MHSDTSDVFLKKKAFNLRRLICLGHGAGNFLKQRLTSELALIVPQFEREYFGQSLEAGGLCVAARTS